MTPAKIAWIKIEGQNKWMTIIQNATKPYKTEFILRFLGVGRMYTMKMVGLVNTRGL
jgi:hypothetical protein